MQITVLQSGFVTGDFLNPVAYAGEMNSRVIEITHPTFDNSFYQLLIIKESRPYVLGIQDGKFMLPPSLIDVPTTLQCQFMALRKNEGIDIMADMCGCYPTSSNDCSHMIFKSDKFNLIVAEGLNINGLTPIPPYEQLVDMYNNLSKAKIAVEQAKIENENVATTIDDKIQQLQSSTYNKTLEKERMIRENTDNQILRKLESISASLSDINVKIDEKSIYMINYYVDDLLITTQVKRYNETINLINYIPTKETQTFKNWIDNETETYYNSGEEYSENKDLNLYAVWE